ncbi:PREDICTED: rho GTPase-activating protein gacGG-like isoform X2 [Ipomoea nil]|uniref:rho GTPase-activating protein gacGG-like isoform X2 n=1 Tax=Ipomoea nil TaxID=35883 RepID=UPI000900CBF1|nr:PREDICTED: rho GTPase-activating protein gacGG-like isoform X2 [Ipomoea nil]
MGNYKGAAEKEQENGDDEDEALSLCDLPNKQESQFKKESPASGGGEEEFDFCSWGGSTLKESEMCAADEVFFRGQILPLRHSISSDGGNAAGIRCNSMDRCHSAGHTTASSRSSSTRSHQSSSSAASSSTTTTHRKIRNQFQYSQPSPTPQLRFSKAPHANNYARNNSTLWSLFRVGLVTMPEIGSHSFRAQNRDDNNNNNNNRNNIVRSGSSSSSIVSNSDTKPNITQKLKQRFSFSDKNLVFFDTCKCSSNSVQTIPSAPAKNQDQKKNKKNTKQQPTTTGKQTMSRIRTFEWLKQLSLEAEGAATTVPLNN